MDTALDRAASPPPYALDAPVPFLDLATVHAPLKRELLAAVEAAIDASAFVNGPAVQSFEQAFARFCGVDHCVGVASGLDALRLGLIALGVRPGDEVVVPAMTFAATVEAVLQVGARPVIADIRDDDFGLDVRSVERALGSATRVVVPVHLYGQMADVGGLLRLVERRRLLVLEDACQAHGAERDGARAGSFGTAAAFSFYPGKNLGALGDAGALVTPHEAVAERVRALREHGQTEKYHHRHVGYTARLDAIQAAVLERKLPHLPGWNESRRRAAALYMELLDGVGDLRLPATQPGSSHVWHLFTIRTADPGALAAFLSERGIGSGRHYPVPMHLTAAFASLGYGPGDFPVAEAVARETLSLPLYPGIPDEAVAHVARTVRAWFDGA
jgi:dTDP-4-amino-4,6-dideoxygalactose transaminase